MATPKEGSIQKKKHILIGKFILEEKAFSNLSLKTGSQKVTCILTWKKKMLENDQIMTKTAAVML